MKFADIAGKRSEAQPGLSATCPSCGAAVIAKCGDHRVWHWAHRGVRDCDQWWESETQWHRAWKNEFPIDWQEIVHVANDGERHVADVRTEAGMVIEFQHSFLNARERTAREAFYGKMVWIVDGRRRKRDAARLLACIGPSVWVRPPHILHLSNHAECALLRDWSSSSFPVYFDLGIREGDGRSIFWRLDPIRQNDRLYLTPVSRQSVLKVHREGLDSEKLFSEGVREIVQFLQQTSQRHQVFPLSDFQRLRTRRNSFRRRF